MPIKKIPTVSRRFPVLLAGAAAILIGIAGTAAALLTRSSN
jgi:hypothetical protein